MITKAIKTFTATIYMAGDIDVAKQVCREACRMKGLCVTVTPTDYIYTGGQEAGFAIGLVNYPKFPVPERDLVGRATALAEFIRDRCCQDSYMIVTPSETLWFTTRSA
jgi:hypothetical protein